MYDGVRDADASRLSQDHGKIVFTDYHADIVCDWNDAEHSAGEGACNLRSTYFPDVRSDFFDE